jgi:hypothetical protein
MFDFFCGMSENLLAIEKSRFFLFAKTTPGRNRKDWICPRQMLRIIPPKVLWRLKR